MITLIEENKALVGIHEACLAFNLPESTYFRWMKQRVVGDGHKTKKKSHRSLSDDEKNEVLDVMTSERYADMAPAAIVASMLDEGKYLCSSRQMYRILEENKAVRERRDQLRHPKYKKPELIATAPNQVWTWDITKIKTGVKFQYYHIYVIIDMFSRYVVGWTIAGHESAELANQLIKESCEKQNISKGQLTIHADNGAAMKSQSVSQLMSDLDVVRSHSRPHVSDDNPFSEAFFKTLKYHSTFPKTFPCIEDAKVFLRAWFLWYNSEHHHSGIAMLCPVHVHTGQAQEILDKREEVLGKAYQLHPERFSKGRPRIKPLSRAVWINEPKEKASSDA